MPRDTRLIQLGLDDWREYQNGEEALDLICYLVGSRAGLITPRLSKDELAAKIDEVADSLEERGAEVLDAERDNANDDDGDSRGEQEREDQRLGRLA